MGETYDVRLAPAATRTIHEKPPSREDMPKIATLDDAITAFGIPTRFAYDENGDRTLIYEYDLTKGRQLIIGQIFWPLLGFAHHHRSFDRLEVELDANHKVKEAFVVTVSDGTEYRLNPWWDGDSEG